MSRTYLIEKATRTTCRLLCFRKHSARRQTCVNTWMRSSWTFIEQCMRTRSKPSAYDRMNHFRRAFIRLHSLLNDFRKCQKEAMNRIYYRRLCTALRMSPFVTFDQLAILNNSSLYLPLGKRFKNEKSRSLRLAWPKGIKESIEESGWKSKLVALSLCNPPNMRRGPPALRPS